MVRDQHVPSSNTADCCGNLLPKDAGSEILLNSTVHGPTITGISHTKAKNVGFISMRQGILPVAWRTGYFALVIVNF